MNYDKEAIGKRIRETRIAAGIKSQSEFAEKVGYTAESRQTVGKWETGQVFPSIYNFRDMSRVLKCDIGYLLCEYDCKTRETADISQATGLSENAVNKLMAINTGERREIINTLSRIIEQDDFISLLSAIHVHDWNFNKGQLKIEREDSDRVARIMACQKDDVKRYMEASSKALIEYSFMKIIETLGNHEETESRRKAKKLFERECKVKCVSSE